MNIYFSEEPRTDIQIRLPDERIITGYRGTKLRELLSLLEEWEGAKIVGAVVDGELRELTYAIERDCSVTPVNMKSSDGSKIYRRSLTFLLETAFHELFPNTFLSIDHSVPNGGYFSKVIGHTQLSLDEVTNLEKHMRKLVQQDLPINKEKVDLKDAIAYFEDKGYHDKTHLLKYRKKNYLILYQLNDHFNYHHGYMVPSTGFLDTFKLIHHEDGFILQYPRRATPTQLFPMPKYSKLLGIFQQYGSWLESLDIDSTASLNDAIQNGSIG